MQDTGILHYLLDKAFYERFGINMEVNFQESAIRKWTPIINPRMIPAYVGLSLGLTFAILIFFVEVLSGQQKQDTRVGIVMLPNVMLGWMRSK